MTPTTAASTRAINAIVSQLGEADISLTENQKPDESYDPEAEDE